LRGGERVDVRDVRDVRDDGRTAEAFLLRNIVERLPLTVCAAASAQQDRECENGKYGISHELGRGMRQDRQPTKDIVLYGARWRKGKPSNVVATKAETQSLLSRLPASRRAPSTAGPRLSPGRRLGEAALATGNRQP